MSDTLRQRIVDALAQRLRQIKTVNGYATNVGDTVYDWFPENLEPEKFPMLVIRDFVDNITDQNNASTLHQLHIELIGLVKIGGNAARELRRVIQDVVRALRGNPDQSYGGLCDQLDVQTGGTLEVEQHADASLASVSISLLATYTTPRDDWAVKK